MKPVSLARIALPLLVLCAPRPGAAQQQPATARIFVDHQGQRIMYQPIGAAEPRPVDADEQIFVLGRDRRAPIPVVIRNTNSALYTCALKQTKVPAPALDTLSQFLTALGPYLTTALPILFRAPMDAAGDVAFAEARERPVREMAAQLQDEMATLNRQIHAARGLGGVHRRALATLNEMRGTPFGVDTVARNGFTAWLGAAPTLCDDGDCQSLTLPEEIAATLAQIQSSRDQLYERLLRYENAGLRRAQDDPTFTEDPRFLAAAQDLVKNADTALKDAPKTLASARAVEGFTRRIVNARSEIACESTGVRWDEGKDLEITVTPRADADLAELAARNERTYKVRVLPDWEFRPSLGLSLIAVPGARYAKYEAVEEGGGQFRVTEAGRTDSRFDYGLTLGLVNRRLDFRRQSNVAIWLPEITINPTEDVKLMAVGVAGSYRMLKVGTGMAWTRHSVLARNSVGDLLASDEISTRETYGKPKLYLSISLMGLPPFLPK